MGFVQEYDLSHKCGYDKNDKHPGEPLVELRFSSSLRCDGGTDPLNAGHTETSNETAYRQVDQHALLAVFWTQPQGNDRAAYEYDTHKRQEARRDNKILHVLDVLYRSLLRRIGRNHNRTNDTAETAHLADKAQALLQEYTRQDSRNHDCQCPQRCDQDGIGKQISSKVAYLANDHECHSRPPPEVLEVSISLARLFVVFFVRLEQAVFLQNEGHPDEQTRANSQYETDDFV